MRHWFAIDDGVARLIDLDTSELGLRHAHERHVANERHHDQSDTRDYWWPSMQMGAASHEHGGGHGGGTIGGGSLVGGGSLAHSTALASSQDHSLVDLGSASSGGNTAGNGGNGTAIGSLIDIDIAIFAPINIAIAIGDGATATATQSNFAWFAQGAHQMAGIGGSGGSGNAALGGDASLYGTLFHMSDASTGGNAAGNGGDGTFIGTMMDNDLAIYMPINIAIAGPGATATAYQDNDAYFLQGATQMAGLGGSGGSDNLALGGDIAALLMDHTDHVFVHG